MNMLNDIAGILCLVIGLLVLGSFYYSYTVSQKLNKLKEDKEKITKKFEDKNVGEIVIEQEKMIKRLDTDIKEIYGICDDLSRLASLGVSKVYLHRYNPFPDTGGDLSFTLTLLNKQNDGVIISSLHGREGTRIYTKPIIKGATKYNLSKEEEYTINKCMGGN